MQFVWSDNIKIHLKKGVIGCLFGLGLGCLFLFKYHLPIEAVLYAALFGVTGFFQPVPQSRSSRTVVWLLWTIACVTLAILYPYYEIYSEKIWIVMKIYTPASAHILNAVLSDSIS